MLTKQVKLYSLLHLSVTQTLTLWLQYDDGDNSGESDSASESDSDAKVSTALPAWSTQCHFGMLLHSYSDIITAAIVIHQALHQYRSCE